MCSSFDQGFPWELPRELPLSFPWEHGGVGNTAVNAAVVLHGQEIECPLQRANHFKYLHLISTKDQGGSNQAIGIATHIFPPYLFALNLWIN